MLDSEPAPPWTVCCGRKRGCIEELPEPAPEAQPAVTETTAPLYLRNLWYHALPSDRVKPGRMEGLTLCGEPIVIGRSADGRVFALRNICPHRGIPLSHGRIAADTVECPYHGWRFAPDGRCTAIPSLVPGQALDVAKIRVRTYPCRESQGNIWCFLGDAAPDRDDQPAIPVLPAVCDRGPRIALSLQFPCFVDHAVIGLMDPAHGPFVHQSPLWRSRRSIHEKSKPFGPIPFGFAMRRHPPSRNSFAYKLLGGRPETEISFRLPGIRIEHITTGRYSLVNLTAVTPVGPTETTITHVMYWDVPWLTLAKPVVRRLARTFLDQDRRVVVQQQDGLRHEPSLMLIRDADTQARWYFQLKTEWERAAAEERPFVNPVKECVLRWCS